MQNIASFAQCPDISTIFPKDSIIICADSSYKMVLPAKPGVSYTWSTNETGNSIDIHQAGKYWVTVTDGACSPVTDSVFVIFNSLILIPNINDALLCLNQPAPPMRAYGQNLKWYSTALSADGTTAAPIPSTADTGITYFYVSQTILGCESPRARVIAEVIDKPTFDLGENIIIPCGAPGVVLQTVEQKYTSYLWQDGSSKPEFLATEAGKYVLKAENICGRLVDTVETVLCNTRCLNFPNAFTPNGDGKNELFRPGTFCPVTKYVFTVYDRFGRQVFHSTNPKEGWDGRVNGKKADMGTYIYYCIYDDFMLKRQLMLKGSVTLIK
ncbi:MAG: gliding motility-associated C-terminal domain-containing protein [Bacteroidetes bacterium]|nr:gliding motility-associated C-terminal domain-containing protein [Bacteroidota bacterium]